jgi:ferritin-like metal-binding protein YciE
LIAEAKKTISHHMEEDMHDPAVTVIAQNTEHYEIAGDGTLLAWASSPGLDEVSELLQQTLEKEKAADST